MVSPASHGGKDRTRPGRVSRSLGGVVDLGGRSGPVWWMPQDISRGIPEVGRSAVSWATVAGGVGQTGPVDGKFVPGENFVQREECRCAGARPYASAGCLSSAPSVREAAAAFNLWLVVTFCRLVCYFFYLNCNHKALPRERLGLVLMTRSTRVSEDPFGNETGQTLLNLSVI